MNLANVSQGIVSLFVGLLVLLGGRILLDKKGRLLALQLLGVFMGITGSTVMLSALPDGWLPVSARLIVVIVVFGLSAAMMIRNSPSKSAGFAFGVVFFGLAVIALFSQASTYFQWLPNGVVKDVIAAGVRSVEQIIEAVGKVI